MIGIPAEKIAAPNEVEPRPGAPDSPAIDAFFSPELTELHGVPTASDRPGRTLAVDPAWGQGSFWYYAIDDALAVSVYDVTYARKTGFDVMTQSCCGLGSYGRGMLPYFGVADEPDRMLLGYVWAARRYAVRIAPGTHIDTVSLMLLGDGLARMARALGRDPAAIARALASLDGTCAVPEVARVLEEVRHARVSGRMARPFYLAKATEALSLLLDWHDARQERGGEKDAGPGGRTRPLAPGELACVGRARAYLRENLSRRVGAAELARASLVSERTLARLFRRVEGCTPGEWAREQRLERACELLRATDLPLAEVARQLGFARQGSLSEAFRERYGTSPRAYRRAAR